MNEGIKEDQQQQNIIGIPFGSQSLGNQKEN